MQHFCCMRKSARVTQLDSEKTAAEENINVSVSFLILRPAPVWYTKNTLASLSYIRWSKWISGSKLWYTMCARFYANSKFKIYRDSTMWTNNGIDAPCCMFSLFDAQHSRALLNVSQKPNSTIHITYRVRCITNAGESATDFDTHRKW